MPAVRTARRPFILVADPNEIIRQVVHIMLAGQGCRVLFAHNAETALRIVARFSSRLDLMIADMSMQASPGFDLADQTGHLAPQLPVLLLSSRKLEESFGSLEHFGPPRDIVAKPFTQASLLSKVRKLLASPARTSRYKTASLGH